MHVRTLRALSATGLGALLVASAVAVAPAARSATATHCANANRIDYAAVPNPLFFTHRDECPGYADGGAPYVFVVDKVSILRIGFPTPGQNTSHFQYDMKATCGSVQESPSGTLRVDACVWTKA
ncbi:MULTISPECIES: hypothetical protein [Streptomyces]|uniref:Uncharacterized protein n=2 Tax=Streptomyces TaxID=1883 RepID=A0A0W7X2Y4_9ACTN|nr:MULTISPECIES: hypothetical protein [Streptomyces]KUF17214.1 hypothetical protein AT728_15355 [Streptomyces silvensis]MVO84688.1 hypothetical protein [Streptomyces typhae]